MIIVLHVTYQILDLFVVKIQEGAMPPCPPDKNIPVYDASYRPVARISQGGGGVFGGGGKCTLSLKGVSFERNVEPLA